jgi:hypothetical protein
LVDFIGGSSVQIDIDEEAGVAILVGDPETEGDARDRLQEALDSEATVELEVEDLGLRANVAEISGGKDAVGRPIWVARLVNLRRETAE